MEKKNIVIISVILVVVVGAITYFAWPKKEQPLTITGSGLTERTSYDAIGTATASSTLTTAYAGNRKVLLTGYLENIHLSIDYAPGADNSYASVLIETSNDNGTTYFPVANKSVGTQSILIYNEDAAGTNAIPLIIPGDMTSTSGTAYRASTDFDLVADHVRISAKESALNSGKIYIRTTITSR